MEVAFEPYRKLSFRSYMEYESPEALANVVAMPVPPGVPAPITLHWANGIVFRGAAYQPTDSIVKEYVSGHLLWDHVDFAPMPQYVKEIKAPDKPLVTVNILDVSKHTVFGPVAQWIRANLIEGKPSATPSKRQGSL